MIDKKLINNLLIIGVVLVIALLVADFNNITPAISGIRAFRSNPLVFAILWGILCSIKIGACIYTLVLYIKSKTLDIIQIIPCILIIHTVDILSEGENLFLIIASIYFTAITSLIIKYRNNN